MKIKVEIIRGSPANREVCYVEIGGIFAGLFVDPDKSDPLNQLVVVGARFGEDKLAIRVAVDGAQQGARERALEGLIAAIIEHRAEIRDVLAAE